MAVHRDRPGGGCDIKPRHAHHDAVVLSSPERPDDTFRGSRIANGATSCPHGLNAFQTSADTALTVSMPYCSDAFPLVSTAIR